MKNDIEVLRNNPLAVLLDCIDFTSGACELTEMVGACIPPEVLSMAKEARNAIPELLEELGRLRHEQFIVWEGDESEGRWRCLMCGAKREGADDTGPEGLEHHGLCGEAGQPIWAYTRMAALAQQGDPDED